MSTSKPQKSIASAAQLACGSFSVRLQWATKQVGAHPTPKRVLRSKEVPRAARRPSAMMAMRSHRMSASSMECVVSTMARSALWRRMMSHVSLAHPPSRKEAAASRVMMLTLYEGMQLQAVPPETNKSATSLAGGNTTQKVRLGEIVFNRSRHDGTRSCA